MSLAPGIHWRGLHLNAFSAISFRLVANVLIAAVVIGCSKPTALDTVNADNLVTASEAAVNRSIGEGKTSYQILSKDSFEKGVISKTIFPANSIEGQAKLKVCAEASGSNDTTTPTTPVPEGKPEESQLLLGFPIGLLGENQIFGGVITAVSDKENETLGQLKLTDLPPLHVRTVVAKTSETQYAMALMGCVSECSEASQQVPLIVLPVAGVDEAKGTVLVDLAPLGKELNLVAMMDPEGEFTKLKAKSSKTVAFDYSLSTLVFDVESHMIPLEADPADATVKETVFNVRWYLRLTSTFNPAFETRPATPGVGFFMTDRSASPKIERHSRTVLGGLSEVTGPVHYFIKNVPQEYQHAFAASFDGWNESFNTLTKVPLFSYEFVPAGDPRNDLLVAGDIRYHIVEWDLVNEAPYGGLGPSIANQFTGEIISSNVLVQGPAIVKIYTQWFEASARANELREEGDEAAANNLMVETMRSIRSQFSMEAAERPISLTLGKNLAFRVVTQMPSLQDPLFEKFTFEEIPTGFTYATYMDGYFTDMLSHELGHNVGLRHNFRGNLSDKGTHEVGSVSHSIMEYLGRGFRHLSRISSYDLMAVQYGYMGIPPAKLNLFCTDEDVASADNATGSPECSRDDATADPFGFFEKRLTKAVNLLVEPGKKTTPSWTVLDMKKELGEALTNLGLYAARAEATGAGWTNFFGIADRPTDVKEIKAFALKHVQSQICDSHLAEIVAQKEGEEAKAKTQANIKDLRAKVTEVLKPLGLADGTELVCQ